MTSKDGEPDALLEQSLHTVDILTLCTPPCRPLALFGFASALYQTDPLNFAFIALLRSGHLHRMVVDFDENPENAMKGLMLVLAHLFGKISRRAVAKETLQAASRNSAS